MEQATTRPICIKMKNSVSSGRDVKVYNPKHTFADFIFLLKIVLIGRDIRRKYVALYCWQKTPMFKFVEVMTCYCRQKIEHGWQINPSEWKIRCIPSQEYSS